MLISAGASKTANTTSKLHLGCFDQPIAGWINTDVTWHLWVARIPGLAALLYRAGKISRSRLEQHKLRIFKQITYLNVTKRFPYKNQTFAAVFSSHMLEHLFAHQAEHCIAESFRVLKEGGICRIAVPDLDKLVAEYSSSQPEVFLKRIFECDPRSKNMHHWHYNATSLPALLKSKGFKEVYQCAYRQGKCPDVELLDNRPGESLFVEAIK